MPVIDTRANIVGDTFEYFGRLGGKEGLRRVWGWCGAGRHGSSWRRRIIHSRGTGSRDADGGHVGGDPHVVRVRSPQGGRHLDRDQARQSLLLTGFGEGGKLAAHRDGGRRDGIFDHAGAWAEICLHRVYIIVVTTTEGGRIGVITDRGSAAAAVITRMWSQFLAIVAIVSIRRMRTIELASLRTHDTFATSRPVVPMAAAAVVGTAGGGGRHGAVGRAILAHRRRADNTADFFCRPQVVSVFARMQGVRGNRG